MGSRQDDEAYDRDHDRYSDLMDSAQSAWTNIAYMIAEELYSHGLRIGSDDLEGVMQYVADAIHDIGDVSSAEYFLSQTSGESVTPSDSEAIIKRAVATARKPKEASIDDSLNKLAIAQNELSAL